MSRTLAPTNPRSCTTRRPSVSILSRFDGLLMIRNMYVRIETVKQPRIRALPPCFQVNPRQPLVAVELRRSLGQRGRNPFLHVGGPGHIRKPVGLTLHLISKWSVRRAKEAFDSLVSPRGALSQFRHERLSMSHELVIRSDPRDETDRFGLARAQHAIG